MGPRLGSRGKAADEGIAIHNLLASMGPRLGSRGKSQFSGVAAEPFNCFNGAATWKSRKANELTRRSIPTKASMGPRLGSRGKLNLRHIRMLFIQLQWGRDLEVAERQTHFQPARGLCLLQWGRDLEVAERGDIRGA